MKEHNPCEFPECNVCGIEWPFEGGRTFMIGDMLYCEDCFIESILEHNADTKELSENAMQEIYCLDDDYECNNDHSNGCDRCKINLIE